jgi:hypothetical protein
MASCSTFETLEVAVLPCHVAQSLVSILLLVKTNLQADNDMIRTILGPVPVLSVKRAKVLWNSFVLVLDSKFSWW